MTDDAEEDSMAPSSDDDDAQEGDDDDDDDSPDGQAQRMPTKSNGRGNLQGGRKEDEGEEKCKTEF